MAKRKARPAGAEDDVENVVLCFKVLMMPRPPVAGCSKVACATCGQLVWISPATAAHVADKPHRICCPECLSSESDPDIVVMPPSDGQIAEIVATDPSITPARLRRIFPASNSTRRKAVLEDVLKRTRKRKRLDN